MGKAADIKTSGQTDSLTIEGCFGLVGKGLDFHVGGLGFDSRSGQPAQ